MSLAYSLGRALRALTGSSRARSTRPTAAPPLLPNWRDARTESLTLRQAVDAMDGHADLLAQLADAWVLSANLKQIDLQRFHANLARARQMGTALEDECAAVVGELRALERQRDRAAELDTIAAKAHRWADGLAAANRALRERLSVVAATQGLDMNELVMEAARHSAETLRAESDALVQGFDDTHSTPMKDYLK